MNRLRRSIPSVLAVAAVAGGMVVATEAPAAANDNVLWVGKVGETHGTFGANAVVRIWGDLRVKTYGCPDGGVNDFVYPTSDVYLVAPGSGYGELTDATGARPNTVVQYASVFDDEVVAMTAPGGKLAEGSYDVVFDTCQDGTYDPEDDTVFPGAVTVTMPPTLPAPDAALSDLKDASHAEYESWKTTRTAMNGVWKMVEKAIKTGCKAGNPLACAMKYGNYFGPIKKSFDELLVNQGVHYLGIYEDPPNEDYKHAVVPEPVAGDESAIGGEAALTQALLRAIEAYKGAQEAGDQRWALVHARAVVALHDALADQLGATDARLAELQGLFSNQADAGLTFAWQYLGRVRTEGFAPAERRTLLENGMTRAQVTALETEVDSTHVARWTAAGVRDVLGATRATHTDTRAALAEGRAGWQAVVDALTADGVPDEHPVAVAAAPARVDEGSGVTLDGAASQRATSHAWDLDGDRDFDDATGASPAVTFDEPGTALVGLRVRDDAGRTAYDWATVAVTASSAAPVVSGTPAERLRTAVTGTVTTFAVTTSDDAGTPSVAWTVDGVAAGTGTTYAWTAPATPGTHQVVATATDADGHTGSFAWDVNVHRSDADGDRYSELLDCDDTDAVVHPGQTEFLGNGVDDDCDAGTADAPPGGLTGSVWAWGDGAYGSLGNGRTMPSYTPPLAATAVPGNVVQVEVDTWASHAVLDSGKVLGWGYNGDGNVGDGTRTTRIQPVPVKSVDGQGELTGVRSVGHSHGHVAATLTTGRVVTWGKQVAGTLGDGSTVHSRPLPGYVLTAPGGEPLEGVRSVAAGHAEDYALMNDGTVRGWGRVTCDGSDKDGEPYDLFPKPIEGLDDIRQVVTSQAIHLFLRKDGAVLSCGGTDPQLGRDWDYNTASPWRPLPVDGLGAGSGVVDISIAGDQVMALKEDGTVLIWGQNTNAGLAPVCGAESCTLETPTVTPLPAGPPVTGVENSDTATPHLIRADGSVVVWGSNHEGSGGKQPGNIMTAQVLDVPGQTVLQVATHSSRTLALTRPHNDPELELPARWVNASVEDAELGEGGDNGFTVTLDQPLRHDASLTWSLAPGSASEADVAPTTGTVVVPAGQTSARVPVTIVDDAVDEDDETVTLSLTGAEHGLTLARPLGTGTIADDDAAPVVSVADVSVVEGDTSLTDLAVTFRLSGRSEKEVVAEYATAAGTATEGTDYVGSAAVIRFAPGETEHEVHLGVVGDLVTEPAETFEVTIPATGAGGTVTLADDEVVGVSATGSTSVEGTALTFEVSLDGALLPGESVEVPWTVVEPTPEGEIAGEPGEVPHDQPGDVVAAAGTVTLTAEEPSATVTTTSVDDQVVEGPEPVLLELSGTPVGSGERGVRVGRSDPAWVSDNDRTNQEPVIQIVTPASGPENSSIPLNAVVTDDAGQATAQWTVDGASCTVAGPGATSSVVCRQDGEYTAVLTATDAEGLTATAEADLVVTNAAPVATRVQVDGTGAVVEFTDAGPDDTHSCRVQWGDESADGVLQGTGSPCRIAHAYQPGSYTATVTVTDDGGLSFTETVPVTVAGEAAWPWRGFLAPVDNLPTVNVIKAGQSVPIKFGLGGYRGMDIFAAGSPASGKVPCTGGQLDPVEEVDTPGASGLTYDAGSDTYHYVWKTQRSWAGTCRTLVVTLADGSSHHAQFRLK